MSMSLLGDAPSNPASLAEMLVLLRIRNRPRARSVQMPSRRLDCQKEAEGDQRGKCISQ